MSEVFVMEPWLCCMDTNGPLSTSQIDTALRQVGVHTRQLNSISPSELGILLCSDLSAEVCEAVREFTCNGACRVLVVTTPQAMSSRIAWQILAAGASDVLAWDRPTDLAAMIAARLQRWRAVDDLLASPLVRNHLVGRSRAWLGMLRQVAEVTRFTEASVLLIGETGTGKELVARLIHALTPCRCEHDLVILDCTTIVPDLSGNELFGHERGAFTGAVTAREGAFALAHEGSLFLDEVGELPLGLQVQLLRVVQEHTYKRVGSNAWHKTDFRLICASNRDLLEEEAHGRFRRDLYYRIASWVFRLPPLRDRREDILPLARHFIRELRPDDEPLELDQPVQEYLLARPYPGNVRDLRNLMQRMVHRHVGNGPITIGDIPADERPAIETAQDSWQDSAFEQVIRRAILCDAGLEEIGRAAEETAIRIATEVEGGNQERAAKRLGRTVRALQMRRAKERQAPPVAESRPGNGGGSRFSPAEPAGFTS